MIAPFIRGMLVMLSALTITPSAIANDRARLTVGVPTYVSHPDKRHDTKGWNQGWLQNEGVIVDVTWPVKTLSRNTTFRAGATGGVFDNSVFHTSVFVGGVGEIETRISENLVLSLGAYAGAITGYENGVRPALAPYVSTSYALTDRFEIGARGFWLPARTLTGSAVAESDAYVAAVTLGTRF